MKLHNIIDRLNPDLRSIDNVDIIRMFGDKIYIVQKIVEQLHGAVMCA